MHQAEIDCDWMWSKLGMGSNLALIEAKITHEGHVYRRSSAVAEPVVPSAKAGLRAVLSACCCRVRDLAYEIDQKDESSWPVHRIWQITTSRSAYTRPVFNANAKRHHSSL